MSDSDDDLTIDGTDLLADLLATRTNERPSNPVPSTPATEPPAAAVTAGTRWSPPVPESPAVRLGSVHRFPITVVIGVFALGLALGVVLAVIGR